MKSLIDGNIKYGKIKDFIIDLLPVALDCILSIVDLSLLFLQS